MGKKTPGARTRAAMADGRAMARTRDFKERLATCVRNDPAFAQALLGEAITLFVNREPESARVILSDLINATVDFEALADEIHKPGKSLHRMLSNSGNPTITNVSAIADGPAASESVAMTGAHSRATQYVRAGDVSPPRYAPFAA